MLNNYSGSMQAEGVACEVVESLNNAMVIGIITIFPLATVYLQIIQHLIKLN